MWIDISTIKDTKGASIEVELSEPVGGLGAAGREIEVRAPVEVRARVTNTGHGALLVQGTARARLRVTCDRCLAPFELEVVCDFEQQCVRGREDGHPTRPSGDEGRTDDVCEYRGDLVDIGPGVRESLSLAIPIKLVCNDECKGLCPSCGKNLNEGPCDCTGRPYDVRFAALADLDLHRRTGNEH